MRIKTDKAYEVPQEQAIILTEFLYRVWDRLGQPTDPLSTPGQKVVEAIIMAYQKTYPIEWRNWLNDRADYQHDELTLHEQLKTGRSLASYPVFIYNVLRKMFPETDFSDRAFVIKFVRAFPAFRMANKV
jgi:hypothetical protein